MGEGDGSSAHDAHLGRGNEHLVCRTGTGVDVRRRFSRPTDGGCALLFSRSGTDVDLRVSVPYDISWTALVEPEGIWVC